MASSITPAVTGARPIAVGARARPHAWLALVAFILLCQAAGGAGATLTDAS